MNLNLKGKPMKHILIAIILCGLLFSQGCLAVAAGLVGGALVGDAMNRAEERRQIEKIRRENERLRWERSQR